jgi:ABC-type multidrug transport system fused ATPase/permease subunit
VSATDELALEEEFARVPLTRKTWGRLVRYFRPYRRSLFLAMAIEASWVVLMIVDPYLVRRAVDGPLPRGDVGGVAGFVAALVGILAFRAVITVIELRISARIGVDVVHDIRKEVFDHLQTLSMRYFDRTKQGRIIARADRDVEALEHLLTWGPVSLTNLVSTLVFASVRLGWAHPHLVVYVLAVMPLLWAVTRVFERHGFPAFRRVRETHSAISAHVAERITGVRVVKAFAGEPREVEALGRLQGAYRASVVRAVGTTAAYVPSLLLVINAMVVLAVLLGGSRVLAGTMTVGLLLESIWLLGMALGPIEGLGGLYNEALVAGAAAERIFLLLDTQPEVRDRPDATDPGRLAGDVAFEGVSFSYDPTGASGPQLVDVSFHARAGERIALVGHTGAGKTSILNLLARFYEPQKGTIRFDGRDGRTMTAAGLHRQMGIVLQENYLFSGTVLENLRFVRPDLGEEEARRGFESLGCAEVLAGLSAGLATEVGERGANLSEGERQVVCFVRAFLADPSILVLDEATSAVDTRTEALVLRALRALSARRTTFVIAHRLSTIRDADRILVLDHGRIVETGRHEDLVAAGGAYARLYAEYAR